jgi:hypothetical protein
MKIIRSVLLLLLALAMHPAAKATNLGAASNNIESGLQQLALQTPIGLTNADALFASALTNDPSSDEARVLKTITGIALIPGTKAFAQFLSSIGFTNSIPGMFSFYDIPLPSADSFGTPILTGNNTLVISYMDTSLRPKISNSIALLSGVSTNVNFTVSIDVPTVVDYADVQLLLCGAYLANAFTYLGDSYNLNILLSDLTKTLAGRTTLQDTLAAYTQLFACSSSNQRALAKTAFSNANTAFQQAISFIINQRVTNQFTQHLIEIDTADPLTLSTVHSTRQRFAALADSFTKPVAFPADTNTPTPFDAQSIYLGAWLNAVASPRSWISSGSLWGNLLNPGGVLDPSFSGILPLMTTSSLSTLLLTNGLIHQVINGGGINSLSGGFYSSQWCSTNFGLSGNRLFGSCYEDNISYGPSYGFLWDGTSNYSALDFPQAQKTQITGITSNGVIWGSYTKGSIDGGFLYANGKFTPVNYPGCFNTVLSCVAGNISAGTFDSVSSGCYGVFLYNGSKYNGAIFYDAQWAQVSGISGSNVFGNYYDFNWNNYGFVYNGVAIASISYPGSYSTSISAVIGGKVFGIYNYNGCFQYYNGVFSPFNYPGTSPEWTWINGNTPPNQVIGNYWDTNNWNRHGFTYDGTKFTSIDFPGASSTSLDGGSAYTNWGSFSGYTNGCFIYRNGSYSVVPLPINQGASINSVYGSNAVGVYSDNINVQHGFLYNGRTLITIDVPGSQSGTTQPSQVSSNWVVGTYSDTNWNYLSFAYWIGSGTPPIIPGTIPNLGSFTIPEKVYGAPAFALTAPTSTSSGAWTYKSGNANVATVSGNTVTIKGVGTSVITAIQAASGSYAGASTSANLVVNKGNPTLGTFTIPAKVYGSAAFVLSAPTSTSTGSWSYSSSDTNVAMVSSSTVTIKGAGAAVITATQAESANYLGASKPANLVVSKATPTLGTLALSAKTYGAAAFTLTPPTSTSLGAWSYSSGNSNVATVSGGAVTIAGAGTAMITATQAESANYTGKSTMGKLVVSKGSQIITFLIPATNTFTSNGLIPLTGTDSANLPITYTSGNNNILSISGPNAVMKAKGTTTVKASQPGNSNYNAAISVVRTIVIK